jgi:hypothetical protein
MTGHGRPQFFNPVIAINGFLIAKENACQSN